MEKRKEIESRGEFLTAEEAREYCKLHGLDIEDGSLFKIAGALRDARRDQEKITRRACAEQMAKLGEEPGSYISTLSHFSKGIDPDEAYAACINVNTFEKR